MSRSTVSRVQHVIGPVWLSWPQIRACRTHCIAVSTPVVPMNTAGPSPSSHLLPACLTACLIALCPPLCGAHPSILTRLRGMRLAVGARGVRPKKDLRSGDTRAAIVPLLAHQLLTAQHEAASSTAGNRPPANSPSNAAGDRPDQDRADQDEVDQDRGEDGGGGGLGDRARARAGSPPYKWLLYGDDDTLWLLSNVLRLLRRYDWTMPYLVAGGFQSVVLLHVYRQGKARCGVCSLTGHRTLV